MKVLIVGYGRMGKQIEEILLARGHQITARVDGNNSGDQKVLTDALLRDADAAIEFALADGIIDRIAQYSRMTLPVVIGTTGWEEKIPEAKALITQEKSSLLRGNNFSVGAHLFFRLTQAAAQWVEKVEEYDLAIMEQHHNKKIDYPSGTAQTAAQAILACVTRKTHILKDLPPSPAPIPPEALQIASLRVGSLPGVHELYLDSPHDYLSIRHEARSRGGFALGAVRGLEWLLGQVGWFEAENFMDDLLQGEKP